MSRTFIIREPGNIQAARAVPRVQGNRATGYLVPEDFDPPAPGFGPPPKLQKKKPRKADRISTAALVFDPVGQDEPSEDHKFMATQAVIVDCEHDREHAVAEVVELVDETGGLGYGA